ncbi:2-oxoglutarate dehydrogenase E1 component [Candidatus Profftella armatura (Diaphorina cf. continua)]|uniref:oxoglutarate dehydrogenase (succinyl-transferring) n=1 Tax=Candidatus Profftella armatura (Diaphorina cf. continua) TaxID=2661583 RepID=A0A7R7AC72_9PROT|nr:2-oxoglutarate dehydrogenase E1 component [Candidatus Profftella armatura (Diaphorina cf. continua)]BCG49500.1 2-oxoglutarate dehydrogenase E1 component [Candidatus Profftella armatura (Diaphorina cf. continua)]
MTNQYEKYNLYSYFYSENLLYIEDLYKSYLKNSNSISENWKICFDLMQSINYQNKLNINFKNLNKETDNISIYKKNHKKFELTSLIDSYRRLGVYFANLDPLKQKIKKINLASKLNIKFYNFNESDMDSIINVNNIFFGVKEITLRNLLKFLKNTYTSNIGSEFMYINNLKEVKWIQEQLESTQATPNFSKEKQKNILFLLTAAEGLERYLHNRYVGQKRFSLEGSESFILSLNEIIQRSGKKGIREIVIGMAHRGRLNVLVNILGKKPKELFDEFEDKNSKNLLSGDVKYHQGFSSNINTPGGIIHLSLAFNPSHLEIINPVVEGSVKARMERRNDKFGTQVLPILVHGDAAFSGQGVVMETLNFSQINNYNTGGTIHIIINNQIGFTTSPNDSRSTLYCSDIGKIIEAPVFHVNGDDPEAVILVTQIAVDYRMKFKKDCIIDIICFRKLGHNEQDTPSLTQPLMYKKIFQHPGIRKLYANKLDTQKILTKHESEHMIKEFNDMINTGKSIVNSIPSNFIHDKFTLKWAPFLKNQYINNFNTNTSISLEKLKILSKKITNIPKNFKLHKLVKKILKDRVAMGCGQLNLDWGMAEHLSYASLVISGYGVRLSGQDSGRGTFSHRHAILYNQDYEYSKKDNISTYVPLHNVSKNQEKFHIINSILSEEAILGFEYGFSTSSPNTLTIWEAQFGDFANGAQVIIDQFISSSEEKWGRISGLTLMLPHGYEGQGPEHSSARLERFLQLCANNNMQIVQPTSASQIFHLLRYQMIRPIRKPLIIITPKSLLRKKEASSTLIDLATGKFNKIISEIDDIINPKKVKRIIACSGKLYYNLFDFRKKKNKNDVAIIRIEQLYPFPHEDFLKILRKFKYFEKLVWAQDEPKNQGAWPQIQENILKNLTSTQKLIYAGRSCSASPASGYYSKHCEEQITLLNNAFFK